MSVVYEARCDCGESLEVDCRLDGGQDLLLIVEKCPECFKMMESLDDNVQSLREQVKTRDEKIERLEDEMLRANDI